MKGENERMVRRIKKMRAVAMLTRLNKKIGESGMEMIQVAILIALAIILGLIFKTEITSFVNKTFTNLNNGF